MRPSLSRMAALSGGLVLVVILSFFYAKELKNFLSIHTCNFVRGDEAKADCFMAVVYRHFEQSGEDAALRTFRSISEIYPSFSKTSCHTLTHLIGDKSYEKLYGEYGRTGIVEIRELLSPFMHLCGYGALHGLLEHAAQRWAEPSFITGMCEDVGEAYRATDMEMAALDACFDAAGHGLFSAHIQKVPMVPDAPGFLEAPLSVCASLDATSAQKEDCKRGVFHRYFDVAEKGEYGLTFSPEFPFKLCEALPQAHASACYARASVRIPETVAQTPAGLLRLVADVQDIDLRNLAFKFGVVGISQRLRDGSGLTAYVSECSKLEATYLRSCIEGAIQGTLLSTASDDGYERLSSMCSTATLGGEQEDYCYGEIFRRLLNHPARDREKLCSLMPVSRRDACVDSSRLSS